MNTPTNPPTNKKRARIMNFIVSFKIENDGASPSIREIAKALDISSTSTVSYELDRLEASGYIRRTFDKARNIEIPGGQWKAPVWFFVKE